MCDWHKNVAQTLTIVDDDVERAQGLLYFGEDGPKAGGISEIRGQAGVRVLFDLGFDCPCHRGNLVPFRLFLSYCGLSHVQTCT